MKNFCKFYGRLLAVLLTSSVFANDWTFNTSDNGDGTVTITRVTPDPTGVLSIPATINDKKVTAIGNEAFSDCSELTGIVIPDGVTSLGWGVFYQCNSLTSVTLPNSITEIGAGAFKFCSSLVSVALPEGLSEVKGYMFYNCTNLVSVSMPECVTSICEYAFYDCAALEKVNMPKSIIHVGECAFSGTPIEDNCQTDVIIWEGCVLRLRHDSTPTSVVLPEGVRVIADQAFYNTTITGISMPNTLRGVGNEAFYQCSKLQTIEFPEGVEYIGNYALFDCDNLKTITIPGSVKRVGSHAIANSDYVESISLGEGIEEIGDDAFSGTGYKRVYNNNSNSVKINIPSTVKKIGSSAFAEIGYGYANVSVADIAKWCECDFTDTSSVPWYYFGSSGGTIDHLTFATGYYWGVLRIPYGPKRISAYAFSEWKFHEICLPNSVTKIEKQAFYKSHIRKIRIPNSVVEIASDAFNGCTSLTNVCVDTRDTPRVRELMRGKGVNVDTLDFVEVEQVDPFDIGDNPTAEQIAETLGNAVDAKVSANIDKMNYNNFRDWAGKVKAKGGSTVGSQGVMDAQNAWVSYALGQDTLLDAAPTDEDLTVETFEPAAESGKFDFTVSVKDVEVGSEAAKENLKKVFGLEGAATLDDAAFLPDNVDITFGTPENGKVKFTAGPKDASAGSFFMKVKMLP